MPESRSLDELVTPRLINRVYVVMRSRLRDQTLAEHATMELFELIVARHERYDPRRGFEAWVMGFVDFVARNAARRDRRRRLHDVPLTEDIQDLEADPTAQIAAFRHLSDEWRRAFASLSMRDRRLIVLRTLEGLPASAVADRLGMTVTNVNTSYRRACARLERELRLPDPA